MIIDINSDLGESFGNDSEVMKYISSANIACGFHAGNPLLIESTIKLALDNSVSIGAHPGYPDIAGFGRRSMKISDDELRTLILYQVGALKSMTEALGGKLNHVKLHGALYNDLAQNYSMAMVACKAIFSISSDLIFVGLANSEMINAAKDVGLKVANEVFADRAYNDDGTLVPRSQNDAVIADQEICLNQIHQLVTEKTIKTITGKVIPMQADTICVHGDNDHAVDFVKALNQFLKDKGIELRSI